MTMGIVGLAAQDRIHNRGKNDLFSPFSAIPPPVVHRIKKGATLGATKKSLF